MPATEFLIDDVIVSSDWWDGITSRALRDWLAANAKAPELLVRINSLGGDAFEGVAMYTALKRHGARIIVEVEGVAASAASIAAMAGDEIRVHKGAQLMIHEAMGVVFGPASDHEKRAGLLRKINGEAADLYAARTGQTRAKVLDMMAQETWMTAEEAKALGFATQVIPAKANVSQTGAKNQLQANMVLQSYRRAPSTLRVFNQAGVRATAPLATEDDTPTWLGRTYSELVPLEKAQLKRADLTLFQQMQANPSRPKTFEQMSGVERAQLNKEDPAKYVRMRDGSSETWKPRSSAAPALASPRAPVLTAHEPPDDSQVTWQGKYLEEMTGPERVSLRHADPERYALMNRWPSKPKAYSDLKPAQLASLKRSDPAKYERMRAGSAELHRVQVG